MKEVVITVFTPVYNRAHCIRNVYDSLLRQTFRDFEWLVINDGSTDNTSEVIQECIRENKLKIRYLEQCNGGKHRAINRAIENANGKLFMSVDSDDDLTPEALDKIVYYENSINNKEQFAGVSGLRCHRNGKIIGTFAPSCNCEYVDVTNIDRFRRNILQGDKAEAYYVKVLKQFYPIPEFSGENWVEEGVLWNRIAYSGLKIRWFNFAIYNCDYLPDGMTKNKMSIYRQNFQGYSLYTKEFIHYNIGLLRKIKITIVYCENARYKKIKYKEIAKNIGIDPLYAFFAYVAGCFSPLRYNLRDMG